MIIKEVALLPTYLPSVAALKEAAKKARDWNSRLEVLQKLEYSPYLEALESLMSKAKPIAIRLDSLANFKIRLPQPTLAAQGRENCKNIFTEELIIP